MGSSDSKASSTEFGSITIQCPKRQFISGEQVDGIIYLNILKSYNGTNLVLNINGVEKSEWTERRGSGDNRHTVHFGQKVDTLERDLPIYSFPDMIATPGQYAFPFSFILPNNLPGSVHYHHSDGSKGSIKYSIEAKLESNVKTMKSISFSAPVYIKELLHKAIKPEVMEKSENLLCCCFCCISRGRTSFKYTTDKNAYMPGETVQVQIEVDNSQCKMDISRIKCQLTENATLVASNHYQKLFESVVVANESKKGIQAGEKVDAIYIDLQLPHEKLTESTEGGIAPTSSGKAIKMVYSIDIELTMDGCVCGQMPRSKLFVQIYSAYVQPIYNFAVPTDWSLKQMPMATLSMGVESLINSHMPLISGNQMSPGYPVEAEAQRLNEASSPQQQQYGQDYYNNKV